MKAHHSHKKPAELTSTITVKVEAKVAEALELMSSHTKIGKDEMVNTALNRYIATHSDYFPPRKK
jgi:hypothetical protein